LTATNAQAELRQQVESALAASHAAATALTTSATRIHELETSAADLRVQLSTSQDHARELEALLSLAKEEHTEAAASAAAALQQLRARVLEMEQEVGGLVGLRIELAASRDYAKELESALEQAQQEGAEALHETEAATESKSKALAARVAEIEDTLQRELEAAGEEVDKQAAECEALRRQLQDTQRALAEARAAAAQSQRELEQTRQQLTDQAHTSQAADAKVRVCSRGEAMQ
jgi:chromosome segregation ATPase